MTVAELIDLLEDMDSTARVIMKFDNGSLVWQYECVESVYADEDGDCLISHEEQEDEE
jgi:hypothetical protein